MLCWSLFRSAQGAVPFSITTHRVESLWEDEIIERARKAKHDFSA